MREKVSRELDIIFDIDGTLLNIQHRVHHLHKTPKPADFENLSFRYLPEISNPQKFITEKLSSSISVRARKIRSCIEFNKTLGARNVS